MKNTNVSDYGPLTYAEQRLIARGHCVADRAMNHEQISKQNPLPFKLWDRDRTIRAKLLIQYIKGQLVKDDETIHPPSSGIAVYGARISGAFNISGLHVDRRMLFVSCGFDQDITFQHSKLTALNLRNCLIPSISATAAHIEGDFFINDSIIEEDVDLSGCEIRGSAYLSRTKFYGERVSLDLSNATIHETLIAQKSFFRGPVVLDNTKTGSNFRFSESVFCAEKESVSAPNLHIGGSFEITNIIAYGSISLTGASITSVLHAGGGLLLCTGDALYCDRIRVGGSVFLDGDFRSEGCVRFINASIGANLNLSNCRLYSEEGDPSLTLMRAHIKGSIISPKGLTTHGTIDISKAKIDADISILNAYITAKDIGIDAEGASVSGSISIEDSRVISETAIHIPYAKVGTFFSLRGTQLEYPSGFGKFNANSIQAKHITIPGSVYLEDNFFAGGKVNFENSVIDGDLVLHDDEKHLNGREKEDSYVERLVLRGARINGAFLALNKASITSLDMRAASIRSLIDCEESWPRNGGLLLDRCTYETFSGVSPRRASQRLKWLEKQKRDHLDTSFRPQPFEQLALVLRQMGQPKEAQKILIVKANTQTLLNMRSRKILYKIAACSSWLLFGKLVGYGYRPFNAVIAALIFIAIGAAVFSISHKEQYILPTKARSVLGSEFVFCATPPAPYPAFNALAFSIDSFVPFLDFHQEENWLPRQAKSVLQDNCPARTEHIISKAEEPTFYGLFYLGYFWVHIAAGWLLTTLAVAGFSGLIKKD